MEKAPVAHADDRRVIFDPSTIVEGLDGEWYQNKIDILQEKLRELR